jgi:hypothetical protein
MSKASVIEPMPVFLHPAAASAIGHIERLAQTAGGSAYAKWIVSDLARFRIAHCSSVPPVL